MLIHPQIDPVALQLGPLAIHWYGLTYLAAFALFVYLGQLRLNHSPYAEQVAMGTWSKQDVEDILFYGVMGVVLGGRIGYCLFYKPGYYLEHPLEVFAVWQGGMSFHGGMLGVFVATAVFAWQRQRPWLWVTDFIAPCVPTGLAAGRVGNFINVDFKRSQAHRQAWRELLNIPPTAVVALHAGRLSVTEEGNSAVTAMVLERAAPS